MSSHPQMHHPQASHPWMRHPWARARGTQGPSTQEPIGQEPAPAPVERSGTEPLTARTDLRLRLALSLLFTPLFAIGTALLWYWTVRAGPDNVPTSDTLRTLTVLCGVLTAFAVADLLVIRRRMRREP